VKIITKYIVKKKGGIKMSIRKGEEIIKFLGEIGVKKATMSIKKLILLGFLAGVFIAFGGLLAIMVSGDLPLEIWGSIKKLIFAAVFPVGLILVVIAGAELATGNMMIQPLAFLNGNIKLSGVYRNWFYVYIGNVIGSLFVAYLLAYMSGLISSEPFMSYVVNIANAKCNLSWMEAFLRGLGCNWLVGLACWMAFSTDTFGGKVMALWWPVMTFVAVGFEHSIANAFFVPLGLFAGSSATYVGPQLTATWLSFLLNNLIPVTLGNIAGATIFVSLFYWYIFKKEDKEKINIFNIAGVKKQA
jgi:formate transporter